MGVLLLALLAVLAAFLKIFIGLASHKGWDWVGFSQDVVQFAVIGAIVTGVSLGINALALRRQYEATIFRSLSMALYAFQGSVTEVFSVSPTDSAAKKSEFLRTALEIITKTESLDEFAGGLHSLISDYNGPAPSGPGQNAGSPVLAGWASQMWGEFSRVMKLSYDQLNLRGQRRTILSYLVDDLAQMASSTSDLADEAIAVRERTILYLARVQQTDAAIESDLVLRSDSQPPTASTAGTKIYHVSPAALSSTTDRLAFFVAYCDERFADASDIQIRTLVASLPWSLAALQSELIAAAELARKIRILAEQALRPQKVVIPDS